MRNLTPEFRPFDKCWVPHISLVFREMWDATAFDRRIPDPTNERSRFVESHISQKTSEIWGTQHLWKGQAC
jgi:hypothetical protein